MLYVCLGLAPKKVLICLPAIAYHQNVVGYLPIAIKECIGLCLTSFKCALKSHLPEINWNKQSLSPYFPFSTVHTVLLQFFLLPFIILLAVYPSFECYSLHGAASWLCVFSVEKGRKATKKCFFGVNPFS